MNSIKGTHVTLVGITLLVTAGIILLIGIWRNTVVARKIRKSQKQVHGYSKLMDEE